MNTFFIGGTIKSLVKEICENFDVKYKIHTIDELDKDYDLSDLIINNFDFVPEYNQEAQKLFINFYNENFDTFTRMFIRRGPNLLDYHELTNYFTIYYYCFYEIIQKNKIDLIIFNNFPHQGPDYVLYEIAKLINIKTILLTQTIFPNKYLIISDVKNFGSYINEVKKIDENKIKKILSEKDIYRNFTLELREDLKKRGLPLTTHDSISRLSPLYEDKTNNLIKKIFIFKYCKKKLLSLLIKFKLIHRKDNESIYQKNLSEKELNNDKVELLLKNNKKKVLIALHMQPEMSTSLLADEFDDQIRIIEKLYRNNFSEKFSIFVREHPAQSSYQRDEMFFKRLRSFRNIYFLNRDFPMQKILEKVDCVVTSSGTVVWEALNLGKKCLLFGNSWYSKLHGVLQINDKTSDEEISNFIEKDFVKETFYKSLQNLYNSFYDGIVLKSWISIFPQFEDKKNAKKIVKDIKEYIKSN